MTIYRGRFAPSPTGDLHLGSLTAALASYLQARYHNGVWLIRIDDIDPPREIEGSTTRIIETLATLGLEPDEPIIYQSQRTDYYSNYIKLLLDQGLAYPCSCSRRDLSINSHYDNRYPGHCRNGISKPNTPTSIRLRCNDCDITYFDAINGQVSINLWTTCGDFIIRRSDQLFAYQLCCAVDDVAPSITHVVRGADLIDSTFRQIQIHRALGLTSPSYSHIPVLKDVRGNKLSKSENADPLSQYRFVDAMRLALAHLHQIPPANIKTTQGLLSWAIKHWQPTNLSKFWR